MYLRRTQLNSFVTAGAILALSITSSACNTKSSQSNPAGGLQAAQPAAGVAAASLPATFLNCGADLGREGQSFHMATYAICGNTGRLPQSMHDYEQYKLFSNSFQGLTLVPSTDATNSSALLVQTSTDSLGLDARQVANFVPTIEGVNDLSPRPGIEGEVARALLVVEKDSPELFSDPTSTVLYQQFGMFLNNSIYKLPPLPATTTNYEPELTPAAVKMGFMALVLQGALNDAPFLMQPAGITSPHQYINVHPTTIQQLADLKGGLNPIAWVNPYTGLPMQDVPLEAPSAGDYSEIPDAAGVTIVLHYEDIHGGVSSRICANQSDIRERVGRKPLQSY